MTLSYTGAELFQSIIMERDDQRLLLLLESDEDQKIIDVHLDEQQARTLPGYGKGNVLEVARLLAKNGRMPWVICVVDSDFSDIKGEDALPESCLSSHYYDLLVDVLAWSPKILRRVAISAATGSIIIQKEAEYGRPLDEQVLLIGQCVGALRLHSQQAGLDLPMSHFTLEGVSQDLSQEAICRRVAAVGARRSKGALNDNQLNSAIQQVMATQDPKILWNGHDLVGALREILHRGAQQNYKHNVVAALIRTSITCTDIMKVPLYDSLKAWGLSQGRMLWRCGGPPLDS